MAATTDSPFKFPWFSYINCPTSLTLGSTVAQHQQLGQTHHDTKVVSSKSTSAVRYLFWARLKTNLFLFAPLDPCANVGAVGWFILAGADFEGGIPCVCPPLFLQRQWRAPLFLQRQGTWLCGHPGAAAFLLKKCLCPPPKKKFLDPPLTGTVYIRPI